MLDFVRPNILRMQGYEPGEQPQQSDYVKLNTNENPYPPSPRVLEALQQALSGERLRKYPDPLGWQFRETAARIFQVPPEAILIANGSDDALTIITRTLVPENGVICYPNPSYLLYETLAAIQGARCHSVPFTADGDLPPESLPRGVHVTYVPNPNSPTGTVVPRGRLERWPTPLVIDEAYADFAEDNYLQLPLHQERVIVTRSLSKSYSLAGIRFGFAVACPELTRHLYKVKDSYNCDALSLVAATAAIADQEYMRQNVARIRATRQRITPLLRHLGFTVPDSQANFVWCRHAQHSARWLYEQLKARRILVRYMRYPQTEGLRITIGTDADMERLLDELRRLV
ncbi:MAG: histidinol-phosphate transaminase [Gemmatales bacterium]|nr:histidinol-phosphate transaminase [Gemmatales bacterium]MCS7159840.1 histidinol-phosphate transaminase [Gemmatales bacterium]MDW8175039.1 histidinol-phosphate transaminase [Gemmatales bacterium]MDW8223226.1 histidinol-phosphate transaminase [Gemmatales bacterium]